MAHATLKSRGVHPVEKSVRTHFGRDFIPLTDPKPNFQRDRPERTQNLTVMVEYVRPRFDQLERVVITMDQSDPRSKTVA